LENIMTGISSEPDKLRNLNARHSRHADTKRRQDMGVLARERLSVFRRQESTVPGARHAADTAVSNRTTARSRGVALALVVAAQFVLQLDFSIVNVALPTIQRELHVAPADLQWLVTGYALTFGSLLLFGGRLGDLSGHLRILLIGLALFGVTSLGAGLAQSAGALIASRFAQGASAALVAPQALAVVAHMYEEGPARNRALGIFAGSTAAGASAGIVLGGVLTQYTGWRGIFLVNPPIIVVLVVLMMRLLPRDGGRQHVRLDGLGAILITASIASLIYGLSQGQQHGFGATTAIASLLLAVALAVIFVIAQQRVRAPMIPLAILADRARRAALATMVLLGAVVAGYVYFTSLYLQRVLSFSALSTGLALLPSTATVLTVSVLFTRRLLARFSIKSLLVVGLAATALGQLWLSQVRANGVYPSGVLPGILLTSLGIGIVFPTASVAVTAGVGPTERGLAGGLFVTAQQVGAAIGVAALATVAAAQTTAARGSLVAGYRLSYLLAVAVVVTALVIVMVQFRSAGRPHDHHAPRRVET
jgi:EmrB/QacA subfamily drug resistance transporter